MSAAAPHPEHRTSGAKRSPAAQRPWAAALAPWGERASQAAFGMLLLAVVWAPLPLGSNRGWALGLLAALVWLGVSLAAAGLATQAAAGGPGASARRRTRLLPPLALAGFCALVALQQWPGLGEAAGVLSISPFHTRQYLLTALTHLGAWTLVLLTVHNAARAERLLVVVMASGVLQACLAVLLYAQTAPYQWFWTDFVPGGRTTGTFANPDHLAGYMELTLSAGVGWLLVQFARHQGAGGQGWRGGAVAVFEFLLSPKMLSRLLLIVPVVALVMTHSRMGNGAFFVALLLIGAVLALRSQRLRKPALWLVASMLVVDVLIIGQWVGLDRVVERIRDTPLAQASADALPLGQGAAPVYGEESVVDRLRPARLALGAVAERPWLGHGGGTFVTAFPPYKEAGMPWYWTDAHNDYVQVAVDVGLVGLALWLLPALMTAWRCWRLLPDGHSATNRGLAAAALMALACLGLHSMVDFNLHIPANALTLCVLLALAWSQAAPEAPPRQRTGRSPAPDHAD